MHKAIMVIARIQSGVRMGLGIYLEGGLPVLAALHHPLEVQLLTRLGYLRVSLRVSVRSKMSYCARSARRSPKRAIPLALMETVFRKMSSFVRAACQ